MKNVSVIQQSSFSDEKWEEKIKEWHSALTAKVFNLAKDHALDGVRPKNMKELNHYAYAFIQNEAQMMVDENHGRFTPMSGMVISKEILDNVARATWADKVNIKLEKDELQNQLPRLKAAKPNLIRHLRAKQYHLIGGLAAIGDSIMNYPAFRYLGMPTLGALSASGMVFCIVLFGTWYLARYINESTSIRQRIRRYCYAMAPYVILFGALAIARSGELTHVPLFMAETPTYGSDMVQIASTIGAASIVATFIMLYVFTKVVPSKREQEHHDEYQQKHNELTEYKAEIERKEVAIASKEQQAYADAGLALSRWEYAQKKQAQIIGIAYRLACLYKETYRKCTNTEVPQCFFEPVVFTFTTFFNASNNEQQ